MMNETEAKENEGTEETVSETGQATGETVGTADSDNVVDLSDAEGTAIEDPGAETEEPVDPLVALEAENLELKDRFLRAVAETENIRKRSEKQVADARTYAVEKFAGDLLSVGDNLSRALTALTEEAKADLSDPGKSLLQGVEMTEKELIVVMQRHGLKPVEATPGTEFDPNVHQAVGRVPSDQPEGTIADLLQGGWQIGERTLRAAMVTVSAGSTD
ncbi:MAG: nucleotide exchange factor GrpE [Pseudomonadota bacterium]